MLEGMDRIHYLDESCPKCSHAIARDFDGRFCTRCAWEERDPLNTSVYWTHYDEAARDLADAAEDLNIRSMLMPHWLVDALQAVYYAEALND